MQPLRWQADAVMVGVDTVIADDPMLTDRSGLRRRRPLLRVVLDSALRMPLNSKLVATAQKDVIVFTVSNDEASASRSSRAAGPREGLSRAEAGRVPLGKVLDMLGEEGILTLLTETGTRLNTALLAAGLIDRIHFFISPQIMGSDAVPAFAAWPAPSTWPKSKWSATATISGSAHCSATPGPREQLPAERPDAKKNARRRINDRFRQPPSRPQRLSGANGRSRRGRSEFRRAFPEHSLLSPPRIRKISPRSSSFMHDDSSHRRPINSNSLRMHHAFPATPIE